MPISTLISLIPETDVTLRPTMGHHAHAAFLSILKQSNPEVAAAVHAPAAQKPFTVSPLIGKMETRGNLRYIRAGTECRLRFTFLNDELFQHFGKAFLTLTMPPIRLGEAVFQVRQMTSHATEERSWSKSETYAELVQSAKKNTRMSCRFYSPTAFRGMTPRGQETRKDAYLDLIRCYQSWVNKWNAFAPMEFDKTEILAFVREHIQLTSVATETKKLNFGKHSEFGWVGTCAFIFYPEHSFDENLLRAVNCLADFAFYCGTGYKTTMGMGQTRRID